MFRCSYWGFYIWSIRKVVGHTIFFQGSSICFLLENGLLKVYITPVISYVILNLCIFMFFCIPILIPNIDSVSFYWFYYESSYSIQSLLFFGEHLNLYWMTIPLGIKATSVLQLTLALCGIEKCNICPLFIDVGPFSAVGLYKL